MKQYEKYKPSEINWIGDIPNDWEIRRLKYVALVQPSNVDKKTIEGEKPVFLCNYMDVYKNDFIDKSISFMEATATDNEIQKFKIKKGDVLITKDSETPDDIANPALVKGDFENVICAYHLTQIRTNRKYLLGEYLFRLFQEDKFKAQFEVAANGVTRYGLGVASITDAFVPLPSVEEQTSIANYLNEKTSQIDKLVANKQKLIELLKDERTTIINEAVTIGINKTDNLKQSDVDWLGKIPNHWSLIRLKFLVSYIKGYAFKTDFFQTEGIPIVKASDIKNLTIRTGKDFLNPDFVQKFGKVKLNTNDIIISTVGSTPDVLNSAVGQIAIVPENLSNSYLNQNTVKFYSSDESILNKYFLFFVLISNPYRKYLDLHAHGTANQASLNIEDMLDYIIAFPHLQEQVEIFSHIKTETQRIDNTIFKVEKEIELMQEYRRAMISEVVTGKIKVV